MSKVINKFHDGKVKSKLFNEESENENEGFQINEDYAARYERWRSKEELQKLKDRYGENADEEEDDSSSSDDSGDETPPDVFGKDFLRTLSCLKSKDPKVYDKDYKFFDEEIEEKDTKKGEEKKKSQKSMFLKDYERETLLKYNGELPDEERENMELKRKLELKSYSLYEEEQRKLKESFKRNVDSDSEDEDLFTRRVKTKEEMTTERVDYLEWLKGQKDEVEDEEKTKDMKHLRDFWNDPKLEEDEAFLRNYILDKKYLDEKQRNPTYDEITEEPEEEHEEFSEVQEVFEHKYNFRFEEPDQEFIKKYPRTLKESMRRKDTKRKDKRLEIRDRKKREKDQKKQDLKRLKALKRKEILEKISKIKEITGNTKVAFEDMDLEGDFNPEDHDAKMQAVFGEQYDEDGEDAEKPEFPPLDEEYQNEDEDDEFHNWDEWEPAQGEPECEDPEFNMDCDYDPQAASTSGVSSKKMSKKEKKRQSKLYKALNKKKPIFNPDEKTFEEYFDEYYKLDYEDIIDDLPCRFKYRKVIPNDFGLDVEEILVADDKELNAWSSLKKTCQVRTDDEERYDVKAYATKGKNWEKKKKILKSVYPDEVDEVPEQAITTPNENKKKKKANESIDKTGVEENVPEQEIETPNENKKKKKANKSVDETIEENLEVPEPKVETPNEENAPKKKRKKKKKKKQTSNGTESTDGVKSEQSERVVNNVRKRKSSHKWPQNARKHVAGEELSDSRIKAFGWNPKKFRNRLKYAPQ